MSSHRYSDDPRARQRDNYQHFYSVTDPLRDVGCCARVIAFTCPTVAVHSTSGSDRNIKITGTLRGIWFASQADGA